MVDTLPPKPAGRLLVVDDERDLMLALVAALETDGYDVTGCASSAAALQALQAGGFDVLISDLMMPGLDGIGLLRAGLDLDPNLVGLIMTGKGTVPSAVEALKIGAFDYLLKPFTLDSVLLAVTRALELRQVRLENLQLREAVALHDFSDAVSATLDPARVAELTADAARQQLDADLTAVLTPAPAPDGAALVVAATAGAGGPRLGQRLPLNDGLAAWLTRPGSAEPLLFPPLDGDGGFASLFPQPPAGRIVVVPMLASGQVVGVLAVSQQTPRRPFTPGQLKALRLLANAGGAALENAILVDQVRASELRYRELIEHATDGIVTINSRGDYVEVNSALLAWLGYTRDELLALNTRQVVRAGDQAPLLRDLAGMRAGQTILAERQLRRKDGSALQVELSGRQLPDGNFLVIIRNITDRKRAERALRDSESRFAALFQASPAAISLSTLDGVIVDVNQEFERAMGYARAEVVGRPARELDTWAVPAERDRIAADLAQHSRLAGVEVHYRRKSGAIMLALVSYETVEVGDQRFLLTLAQDITDRKQAEDQLRFQAGLLAAVGQAVIATDAQGRIVYWNHMAEKLYGWPAQEALGQSSSILTPAHTDRSLAAAILNQVRAGQTWSGEYLVARRDGTTFPAFVTDTPYYDSRGALAGIIGMSSDISERKQREREMESIAQLSAALRAALTAEQIPQVILDQLQALFGTSAASLGLLYPASQELNTELATGHWAPYTGFRAPANEGITGLVVASGRPYLTQAAASDPLLYPPETAAGVVAVAVLPLIAHGQTIGSLSAGRSEPFTESDLRLLSSIADITANALQRATLHEQTRLRAEQLAGLNELARALAETLQLAQVYERLDATTRQMMPGVDSVTISLYDRAAQQLTAVYRADNGQPLGPAALDAALAGLLEPALDDAEAEVVQTRRTVSVSHADGRVSLLAPLLAKGDVIGVLQASRAGAAGAFVSDEASLLATVASTAAVAIENARLFAETQRRLLRLQALRTIDLAITSSLDSQISLRVLVDQAKTHLEVDAVDVLLLDSQTHRLELAAGRGFRATPPHFSLRVDEGLAGQAIMERRLLRVPRLASLSSPLARGAWFAAEGFATYIGVPLVAKGTVRGVLEVFQRAPLAPDAEWTDFLETLAEQAAIVVDNSLLFSDLQRSNIDLELAYDTTLEGWSRALDLRDKETEGHTQRVTDVTERLARSMGLSEVELLHMRRGGLLHDIGKMGIPDAILLKSGPLTSEEWTIMRRHPVYAYELLAPIAYLRPALDIPYCHHEKWDGTGYPRGLAGDRIPLAARIFAVVDVWDALRSDRPYRQAWPEEKVREYILSLAGTHFDPRVVQAFMELPELR